MTFIALINKSRNIQHEQGHVGSNTKTLTLFSNLELRCRLKANSHRHANLKFEQLIEIVQFTRHARHDRDGTVLSCMVWRCKLSRPDSQTGAFCVWSVSECVQRRSATAGLTLTQNALVRQSVHTVTPDKTRLPRLPVDRRRDAGQAGSYV